jgi:hypothetical protein
MRCGMKLKKPRNTHPLTPSLFLIIGVIPTPALMRTRFFLESGSNTKSPAGALISIESPQRNVLFIHAARSGEYHALRHEAEEAAEHSSVDNQILFGIRV